VPIIDGILADWKAPLPYAHISRDFKGVSSGGVEQIETPDKANAVYMAGMAFPMRDDDSDYAPLALGDFILGNGTLSSRLGDRVREKEGLSYGVTSVLGASAKDERTSLTIFAICNPTNMEKVRTAIHQEIVRMLDKGIPQGELKGAKKGYLDQEQLGRTRDGALAAMLCENLSVGRSMKYYGDIEKRMAGLTADEIISVMKRRIDPKNLFIVTAGDFSKTQSAGTQ
jgi:zinc protease